MKKLLIIDRDGTILREPADEQIDSFAKMSFLPYCIQSLTRISTNTDFEMIMVTNQDGLGTSSFPEKDFWPIHNLMLDILKGEGIGFSEILIDRSTADEPSPGRKPGTGLMQKYLNGDYNLEESYVIGDRYSDLLFAKNLGCKAIFLSEEESNEAQLTTSDWREIGNYILNTDRIAVIERKTSETDIKISVNLDGKGKSIINTGIGFFDHMLEQIAKHGNLDLEISCKGDLHIDEHHTIEDVGLALGEAIRRALGNKRGIERYGFVIPMDESEARITMDFGGRPYFIWKAEFKREMIGAFPTELFEHFFKSFSDKAECNLHIEAKGNNEHHKIEAIFKAFARSIKMAKTKTNDNQIPSTKGIL